jgi:hypothetical protein
MEVVLLNNFDAHNIVFSAVKKNRNGGKFVSLTNGSGPLRIQLPTLRAPFGINPPNDKVREYYLNLSLTPDIEAKFAEFDARVLEFVCDNSVALLNKQVDINVMRDLLYTPIVRPSKDGKYAPVIKLKSSMAEGKNLPEVYNHLREKVSVDDIGKGASVTTIIELNQIYFINGKFGVSIRLNQAKLSPSNKLSGYSFIESDEPTEDDIDLPEDA